MSASPKQQTAFQPVAPSLNIFSPSGVVPKAAQLNLAVKRLRGMGFDARKDPDATARHQRFAGSDEARLAAIHRVALEAPSIAMAARGGYGLSRLLPAIDWKLLAKAVDKGTRWVGYSDFTALQCGLLAQTGAWSWAGPMAIDDFSRDEAAGGLDEVTPEVFGEAMRGELEAVGFSTKAGFDGLSVRGTLWGGNLTMLCSLLGTPWMPKIKGGILFLEDVNEHPYRVERMLLQLLNAGVLRAQKAVLLGHFSAWKPFGLDRGYRLNSALAHIRSQSKVPLLEGLPFGHVATKVCLPVGQRVNLVVQGRSALVGWGR